MYILYMYLWISSIVKLHVYNICTGTLGFMHTVHVHVHVHVDADNILFSVSKNNYWREEEAQCMQNHWQCHTWHIHMHRMRGTSWLLLRFEIQCNTHDVECTCIKLMYEYQSVWSLTKMSKNTTALSTLNFWKILTYSGLPHLTHTHAQDEGHIMASPKVWDNTSTWCGMYMYRINVHSTNIKAFDLRLKWAIPPLYLLWISGKSLHTAASNI